MHHPYLNHNTTIKRSNFSSLERYSPRDKENHYEEDQFTSGRNRSEEFSFSKLMSLESSGKLASIRNDLLHLDRKALVELIMQQVQENKMLRIKVSGLEEQAKMRNSMREDSLRFYTQSPNDDNEMISMTKYTQLAEYMEEYVSNTNEAQNYFLTLIQKLKGQNALIKEQNGQLRAINNSMAQQNDAQNSKQIIKELEQSLSHYMSINNQITCDYNKLNRAHESSCQQLEEALRTIEQRQAELSAERQCRKDQKQMMEEALSQAKSKLYEIERNEKQAVNQLEDNRQLKQRIKLLQVCNHELRQITNSMQKVVENKSDKIRKLLQEMEKVSQQKWKYKEMYMEEKTKNRTFSTMDKNSRFQTPNNKESIDSLIQQFNHDI